MGSSKANGRRRDSGRDSGGFVALPYAVLDSGAYASLGYPARALLLELARQLRPDNNGTLLLSGRYLTARGWHSNDVISRAKRELLTAGFIHETVKGHRPNRASWYAVTWYSLSQNVNYDVGAVGAFQRGAYRLFMPNKNAALIPSPGVERRHIAPSPGVERPSLAPSPGAVMPNFDQLSTPSRGDHIDMPSVCIETNRLKEHHDNHC